MRILIQPLLVLWIQFPLGANSFCVEFLKKNPLNVNIEYKCQKCQIYVENENLDSLCYSHSQNLHTVLSKNAALLITD